MADEIHIPQSNAPTVVTVYVDAPVGERGERGEQGPPVDTSSLFASQAFISAVLALIPPFPTPEPTNPEYANGTSLGLEDNLLVSPDGFVVSMVNKPLAYVNTNVFEDTDGNLHYISTGDLMAGSGNFYLPLESSSKHFFDSQASQGSAGDVLTLNSSGYPQWDVTSYAPVANTRSINASPTTWTIANPIPGPACVMVSLSMRAIAAIVAGTATMTLGWTDIGSTARTMAFAAMGLTVANTRQDFCVLLDVDGIAVVTVTVTFAGIVGSPQVEVNHLTINA